MYAYLTDHPLLNCDTLNLISSKNLKYGCQRNAQEGKYLRQQKFLLHHQVRIFTVSIKFKLGKRVFHSLYKIGRNGIIVFKGFSNSEKKRLPPVGLGLMPEIGLGVQCLTK